MEQYDEIVEKLTNYFEKKQIDNKDAYFITKFMADKYLELVYDDMETQEDEDDDIDNEEEGNEEGYEPDLTEEDDQEEEPTPQVKKKPMPPSPTSLIKKPKMQIKNMKLAKEKVDEGDF